MKNNLKQIRKRAGLTQEQLAEIMGTKKQYICSLETGTRNISTIKTDTMSRLCTALNCSINDLFISDDIFEFDEDGNLIIDNLYLINGLKIIDIKGTYFICPMSSVYYSNREVKNIVDYLKPYMGKISPEDEKLSPEINYPLLGVVPRKGYKIKIGRVITADEFKAFCDKYKITKDDTTQEFVAVKGEIYGKYAKTYTAVQVKIKSNPLIAEEDLTSKGIEANAVTPTLIDIRVK